MLAPEQVVALELVVVLGVAAEFARQGAEVRDVPVSGGVRVGGQPRQPLAPNSRMVSSSQYRSASSSVRSATDLSTRPIRWQDVLAGRLPAAAERLGGSRSNDLRRTSATPPASAPPPSRGRRSLAWWRPASLLRQGPRRPDVSRPKRCSSPCSAATGPGAQLHRGQLDRQRIRRRPHSQTTLRTVLRRGAEAGRGRRGPLGEQCHPRRRARPRSRTGPAGLGFWVQQRRHRAAVLGRHVHRLGAVARIVTWPASRSTGLASSARTDQVLAGVEDEQSWRPAGVHDRVPLGPGLLSGQAEQVARCTTADRDPQSAELGEADAVRGRPRTSPRPAARWRVFPTPPGRHGHHPAVPSNPSSTASSRWRPTKPVTLAAAHQDRVGSTYVSSCPHWTYTRPRITGVPTAPVHERGWGRKTGRLPGPGRVARGCAAPWSCPCSTPSSSRPG